MPQRTEVTLADGARLFVEVSGPASAPLTVILLHGWCLDRRTWQNQVTALRALQPRPRVIRYDARGHGNSGAVRLRDATLGRLGEDLAAVIERFAPTGPIVLAGHSMGGMTIIEYAAAQPAEFAARVAGVVFVSTTAEGHTHTRYGLPTQLAMLLRHGETLGAGVLARSGPWRPHRVVLPVLRPAVRWLLFGDECPDVALALTLNAVARASLRSIGGFRPSIGAQARLDTLTGWHGVPAAVLVGERDRLTPPACGHSIAAALPQGKLTVYPGAGHMLMLERPAEVTEVLAAVVRRATQQRRRGGYGAAA